MLSGAPPSNTVAECGRVRVFRAAILRMSCCRRQDRSHCRLVCQLHQVNAPIAAAKRAVRAAVARLRRFTQLPVAVGFGIKTPAQAAEVARAADAAVVGSAVVDRLALNLDPEGHARPGLVDAVLADIRALAAGVRGARRT